MYVYIYISTIYKISEGTTSLKNIKPNKKLSHENQPLLTTTERFFADVNLNLGLAQP